MLTSTPSETAAGVVSLIRRADAYRLLAAAFCQPCDAWREERLFLNLADLLTGLYPEARGAALRLASAYETADHESLCVEAARLFVGPFQLAVPPYGSCHTDDGRRVMGDSTLAVQALYREWGFELAAGANEMPDHISVELEFMHILLHQLAKAYQADSKALVSRTVSALNRFMHRHLFPFASAMAHQLKEHARHDVYRSLADVLLIFLKGERETLQSPVTPV